MHFKNDGHHHQGVKTFSQLEIAEGDFFFIALS